MNWPILSSQLIITQDSKMVRMVAVAAPSVAFVLHWFCPEADKTDVIFC